MPIYEYQCRQCGHRFEQLVRTGSRPACAKCGSRGLEKQFSSFSVGAAGSNAAIGPATDGPLCSTCGDLPGSCASRMP